MRVRVHCNSCKYYHKANKTFRQNRRIQNTEICRSSPPVGVFRGRRYRMNLTVHHSHGKIHGRGYIPTYHSFEWQTCLTDMCRHTWLSPGQPGPSEDARSGKISSSYHRAGDTTHTPRYTPRRTLYLGSCTSSSATQRWSLYMPCRTIQMDHYMRYSLWDRYGRIYQQTGRDLSHTGSCRSPQTRCSLPCRTYTVHLNRTADTIQPHRTASRHDLS